MVLGSVSISTKMKMLKTKELLDTETESTQNMIFKFYFLVGHTIQFYKKKFYEYQEV